MSVRVLAVAESDSSGAVGIQADIKTILALGGYAMTAISRVAAQNTHALLEYADMKPDFVAAQMRACLRGGHVNAIKIGFLVSADMVDAVGDVLDEWQKKETPVVVDPSVVLRTGQVVVDAAAIAAWKRRLYIRATVLTPNLREAELLSGMKIHDLDTMREAADALRTLGVENMVLKARQFISNKETYVVATGSGERIYEMPVLQTSRTLGAGSTFSSAIATGLGSGLDIFSAVERALSFLHQAMMGAADTGEAGPLNHAFNIKGQKNFYDNDFGSGFIKSTWSKA